MSLINVVSLKGEMSMIIKDLYPDITTTDHHDVIQQAVNECDVVYLHSRNSAGTFTLNFDVGPNPIVVKKSTRIVGVLDDPNDPKPLIKGRSGWLVTDKNSEGDPRAGIFGIATSGCVEITNLHLDHSAPEYPAGATSMHGNATIAYFPENTLPSTLRVTDCTIDTAATSGISIDNTIPQDPNTKRRLDVFIHGCVIKGKNHPDASLIQYQPGTYVGVRLGGLIPPFPIVDMRDSVFEVSDCTLDVANFAGLAVGFVESNSNSVFVISGNTIGHHPNSGLEVTSIGVAFIDDSVASGPRGTIRITDNKIKLQGYFFYPEPDWSTGILVGVKNASSQQSVNTTVTGNSIDFSQTVAPQWASGVNKPGMLGLTGIIYQDDEATKGSVNATALIANNLVRAHSPVNPSRGIWLRNAAHDVTVVGNDLTGLVASYAQMAVDTSAHNCIFSGNYHGGLGDMQNLKPVAVVLCDGHDNNFRCGNFSKQALAGWLAGGLGGPGRLKLDVNSQFNKAHLEVPASKPHKETVLLTYQWIDLGSNNDVSIKQEKVDTENKYIPDKPPVIEKMPPIEVHPPPVNPLTARDKGMTRIR